MSLEDDLFPPGVAYVDGAYCPISEAKISVLDFGFLRSDATYDVVHVWQGRFFRLDAHLDRFEASVAKLRMSLPFGRERLSEILHGCVLEAGFSDAYVEMICTRGIPPRYTRDPRAATNRFMAFAIPFGWIADEEQRRRGLHIAVSRVPRIPPQSVDPTVKNYHWMDLVAGLFEAYDHGAENVVLVDFEGKITEGPGFNLFVVKDGRVVTPESGVLQGITRDTALKLAAELGNPAEPGKVTAADLKGADEVFITSTAGGVMPVTRVDSLDVGNGQPGPFTTELTALYWDKHSDDAWSTPVG